MNLEDFFTNDIQNIAELLDESRLSEIYLKVSEKYLEDKGLMGSKIDDLKSYVKLASLISERNKPFENASDIVFPLAANACIQYGSTAYGALFSDDEIAKLKIVGSDNGKIALNDAGEPIIGEDGQPERIFVGYKREIGKRLTTVINYQLTEEMSYWKTDAIKSMYRLPALGFFYKKPYWDFVVNKPSSKVVMPDKIILNPAINCLEGSVYSEILDIDKKTIATNIKRGLWKAFDFERTSNTSFSPQSGLTDETKKTDNIEFIEQHTFLDLDDDGIDEPYCVIFENSSQNIVRISPDYDLDNIYKNEKGQIYYVERNEQLVDFGFLPDFGGGFFSIGFAQLLQPQNAAINASVNQMLDAMNLALKGGGFVSTGIDLRGGMLTWKMGEYKKVNVANGNLAANVFPLPFPQPSPVMFSLLGLLIESGKETGSLRDVLTGDTAANMAPTTYMGLVEQGMKQSIAILKNNHESFKRELKILRRLNGKYLSQEKYVEILDAQPTDFNLDPKSNFSEKNCDIVLVTDTASITSAQKFAQAQLLASLKDDPFYNGLEIRRLFNDAIQMPQLNELISPPPPSPDAALVLAQAEDKKAEAKLAETQIKGEEIFAKINEMAQKLNLMESEIKVNESEVIKNISDAISKEKETTLKELTEVEKSIQNRIDLAIKARTAELQYERRAEEKSEGVAE